MARHGEEHVEVSLGPRGGGSMQTCVAPTPMMAALTEAGGPAGILEPCFPGPEAQQGSMGPRVMAATGWGCQQAWQGPGALEQWPSQWRACLPLSGKSPPALYPPPPRPPAHFWSSRASASPVWASPRRRAWSPDGCLWGLLWPQRVPRGACRWAGRHQTPRGHQCGRLPSGREPWAPGPAPSSINCALFAIFV